jgi:hypothetical protein
MAIRHLKVQRQQAETSKSKAILEVVQEDLQALIEKMEAVLQCKESPDPGSELGGNSLAQMQKTAGIDGIEAKM